MTSTTLTDGRIKHEIPGWVGYQSPGQSMLKTKWFKDGVKYWEVEGSQTYLVTKDTMGKMNCECKGFMFRKKCRHITEILEKGQL
jgi:hypothetical protein